MLIALLTALALAGPAPQDHLQAGMAAQRAGDVDGALGHYRACLAADPQAVACHWEIGWSHWTRARWTEVVRHWETVARLDPEHPEVGRWLPTARENLAGEQRMAEALATAPARARPALPPGRTLRLRLVGDIMIGTTSPHPTAHLPPDDGAGYFDAVDEALADADITFGNLEGPLCDTTVRAAKCQGDAPCYAFRQPTRYAGLLVEAGFDLLSIANNHMMDFEAPCRDQTIATLDSAGLAWSGPPGSVATVEHEGIRVAMIAFHTARHSNYINDHDNARALVELADRTHDLVIVSFHGGAEGSRAMRVPDRMETFYGEKRGHLRRFARDVVGAGADLVVGHGPHVLRGLELVDGRLVAYSLGNFATYGRFNLSGPLGIAGILEVELDHEGRLIRGRLVPTRQRDPGVPELDPEGRGIGLLRDLTRQDFPETGPVIARDGTFAPPPAATAD